jgi:hypothetical protein
LALKLLIELGLRKLVKINLTFILKPKLFIGYENDKLAIATLEKEKRKRNERFQIF